MRGSRSRVPRVLGLRLRKPFRSSTSYRTAVPKYLSPIIDVHVGLRCELQGERDEADRKFERVIEIDETVYGPGHPHVAIDLNAWASSLFEQVGVGAWEMCGMPGWGGALLIEECALLTASAQNLCYSISMLNFLSKPVRRRN